MSQQQDKWKDNQTFNTRFEYFLMPGFSLKSLLSSTIFIDEQTGFSNDLNIHKATVGIHYQPNPAKKKQLPVTLSSTGGIITDRRYEFMDVGTAYNFDLNLNEFKTANYYNDLLVKLNYDVFKNRKNEDATLFYKINREFYKETTDTLTLLFDQTRRDYYISAKGDIEYFKETVALFNNNLNYHIADGFGVKIMNQVRSREVNITQFIPGSSIEEEKRERTDFRFDNEFKLHFEKQKIESYLKLEYWSQEQAYKSPSAAKSLPLSHRMSFIAPDNSSYLFGVEALVGGRFLKSDSVSFGTSISRLQYDTPDSSNFDDRDEVRLNFRLAEFHTFSPNLHLKMEFVVRLYHLTYIFGERSADNSWNRIFKIAPQINYYLSSNFFMQQSFEVLANYVDYDFEFEQGDVKSFVYRKFQSKSLCNWQITQRTGIRLSYLLEFEENGKLFWDQWLERPLLSRQNNWIRGFISFRPFQFFRISPGFSFFKRDEWKFSFSREGTLQKEKYSDFYSLGPTFNLSYQPREQLKLVFLLSRNQIQSSQKKKYYLTNIDIELNLNF